MLGDGPFFSPGHAADLTHVTNAALSLAEYFRVSPYEFFDRDSAEILNLHRMAQVFIRQRKADAL